MTTSGDLATWYTNLVERAETETEPAAVLADWNAAFDDSSSLPALEQHKRGFLRLAARLRATRTAAAEADLEAAITASEARIGMALEGRQADLGLGFRLAGARERAVTAEAIVNDDSVGWTSADIDELEAVACAWSKDEWCTWLNVGFLAVRRDDPDAYLAFAPLRLYPVGRYVEQVAEVLSERTVRGALLRSLVVDAVDNFLRSGEPRGLTAEREFWMLLHELDIRDSNASLVRAYLKRKAKADKPIPDEIVEEICTLAWSCCANPTARASFFQTMVRTPGVKMDAWEIAALIEETATAELEGESSDATKLAADIMADRRLRVPTVGEHLQRLVDEGFLSHASKLFGAGAVTAAGLNRALGELAGRTVLGTSAPEHTEPAVLRDEDLLVLEGAL